jgi:glutathione S-transferase
MKLLIGNKNYSSWSLRPWLLLTGLEIPFEEQKLSFNDPEFKTKVRRYSPVGKVPVLVDDDGTVVWDSLAIVEYVAEKFPDRRVWPQDRQARALARSICAEMHSGFSHLRGRMPMNCELKFQPQVLEVPVRRDIARIVDIWTDCRRHFGGGGPFLFGPFGAADAYFAPVVRRLLEFSVELPEIARAYAAAVDGLPAMRAWVSAGLVEHDFVVEDEPFRDPPPGAVHRLSGK